MHSEHPEGLALTPLLPEAIGVNKMIRKDYSIYRKDVALSEKMKLNNVAPQKVIKAVDRLNNRPGKCLNFKTPYEVFFALTGIDVKNIKGYTLIT
jgi:hypothetical protein